MTQTVREMMTMKKLMLRMSQKTQMTKSSAPTKVWTSDQLRPGCSASQKLLKVSNVKGFRIKAPPIIRDKAYLWAASLAVKTASKQLEGVQLDPLKISSTSRRSFNRLVELRVSVLRILQLCDSKPQTVTSGKSPLDNPWMKVITARLTCNFYLHNSISLLQTMLTLHLANT